MGFLGFEDDYEEYKSTEKSSNIIGTTGNIISCENLPEMTQEEYDLIKDICIHNDPDIVYMQSNPDFYDSYYNQESTDTSESFYNFDEVKNIRRIYKKYSKFAEAELLRENYMKYLVYKYGGELMYSIKLSAGLVKEWIPPIPVLATSSPDYKYYVMGMAPPTGEWNSEMAVKIFKDHLDNLDIDVDSIGVRADVLTDPQIINAIHGTTGDNGIFIPTRSKLDNSFNGVTTGDLDELQSMLKSMLSGEDTKETTDEKFEFFSKSEEAIRRNYFASPLVDGGGLANAMQYGVEPDDESEDSNRMILDDDTKRPMTVRESQVRKLIKQLDVEHGYNQLRLMELFGVGSNSELNKIRRDLQNRSKYKKKASSLMYDIIGESENYITSIDELNDILFDD